MFNELTALLANWLVPIPPLATPSGATVVPAPAKVASWATEVRGGVGAPATLLRDTRRFGTAYYLQLDPPRNFVKNPNRATEHLGTE